MSSARDTMWRCCARLVFVPALKTIRESCWAGSRAATPYTLLDYMPKDYLMFVDESHVMLPQVRGMYGGDHSRKVSLVDYGFRLPSAFDNRPLNFEEFESRINQVIFVSAPRRGSMKGSTPRRLWSRSSAPPACSTPGIEVRPVTGQIDDLVSEINKRSQKNERVLITTLTKKMAEDLTSYFENLGIRVRYMHHDVETIERMEIIRKLRLGEFDVLVGINLLREGLDIPEVSLVAILDADKEGFLRWDHQPHPDHRARRAQCRRHGHHVCRPHHRFHAGGNRRDRTAAGPSRSDYNERARHRAQDHHQGCARRH